MDILVVHRHANVCSTITTAHHTPANSIAPWKLISGALKVYTHTHTSVRAVRVRETKGFLHFFLLTAVITRQADGQSRCNHRHLKEKILHAIHGEREKKKNQYQDLLLW